MSVLRNEQDVREEVATPFLKSLGYESGTANDISREHRLRYAAFQLGRKKQSDVRLPQGGDADYLMSVAGAGRWVLETKPPSEEITADDIDQAVSYARHPEVSAHYAAVLNGRRFVLYYSTQSSNDKPHLDTEVSSPEELAKALDGLLSPLAIRRDCTPPVVDPRAPLAPGFRGEARIIGGSNTQLAVNSITNLPLPPQKLAELKAQQERYVGMSSFVKSGKIWRDEASRIRARISWHSPHEEMKPFLETVRLDEFEYVCLENSISTNPEAPSVFDILAGFEFKRGQVIYDLLHSKVQVAGVNADVVMQGQAIGHLRGTEFVGVANFCATMSLKGLPFSMKTHHLTEFSFTVDGR